jgi:hypothetical protein
MSLCEYSVPLTLLHCRRSWSAGRDWCSRKEYHRPTGVRSSERLISLFAPFSLFVLLTFFALLSLSSAPLALLALP